MVAACCVKGCKREKYGGCGTSFHKFPSDEKRRQQWVISLRGTKVTPSSVVCDRHFRHNDFYIANSQRMLRIGAVPSVLPVPRTGRLITPGYCYAPKQDPASEVVESSLTSQNITDFDEDGNIEFLEEEYLEEVSVSNEDFSGVGVASEEVSEVGVSNEDVSEVSNEDVSEAEVSNEDVSEAEISNESMSEAEVSNENVSEVEVSNEDVSEAEVSDEDISNSNEDMSEEETKDQPNDTSAVLKRKRILQGSTTTTTLVTANQQMLKIRKQSAQIDKMKRRVSEHNDRIRLLSTQVQRRNSKVSLLEKTIDSLKSNLNKCHDESLLLNGSHPKSLDFLRRQSMLKLKKNYSAEIRKLALSLNLLSPKAYQFIRNTYQTSLPNPRVLNKWYQSGNASKVLSSKVQALKNIWSGSEQEEANQTEEQNDAAIDSMQENYTENEMEI